MCTWKKYTTIAEEFAIRMLDHILDVFVIINSKKLKKQDKKYFLRGIYTNIEMSENLSMLHTCMCKTI